MMAAWSPRTKPLRRILMREKDNIPFSNRGLISDVYTEMDNVLSLDELRLIKLGHCEFSMTNRRQVQPGVG
jgi:hypothetical protein